MRLFLTLHLCLTLLAGVGCSREPALSVEIPWAMAGDWLVADTHSHTRFSDGSLALSGLVERGVSSGCDVMAVTDHGDLDRQAATPAYFAAVRAARKRHPGLILLGGMEWNIPPYEGREHVTVLVAPKIEEPVLSGLKRRFEAPGAQAEAALQWLEGQAPGQDDVVLIYNHPSRKVPAVAQSGEDLERWRGVSRRIIGFEGAPGHQRMNEPGSYRRPGLTNDRWDPVAAQIGGVWDQLLDQGEDVWAAIATSDFHNSDMDYSPCAFARIHLEVPERSARGVLAALRAGSFWADHGRLLDELSVTASASSLPASISPGESAEIPAEDSIRIGIYLKRGPGAEGAALHLELIGNGRSGKSELLEQLTLAPDQSGGSWALHNPVPGADGESAYFRLRVRKPVEQGPDLMAYTNSIRFRLF